MTRMNHIRRLGAVVALLAICTGAFARHPAASEVDDDDCALINTPAKSAPASFGARMSKARAAKSKGPRAPRTRKTRVPKTPKAPKEPSIDNIGN